MPIEKIETVKKPVVGRYYLVPCVKMDSHHRSKRKIMVPVIGPWHEDSDIGVKQYHFHYDVRFMSERHVMPTPSHLHPASRLRDPFERQMIRVKTSDTVAYDDRGTDKDKNASCTIFYRRIRMKREMPDFPSHDATGFPSRLVETLEPKFEHVPMKCNTCPHRGMDLSQLPVAADGTVVCNGHGLKWHLKTGRMVKR